MTHDSWRDAVHVIARLTGSTNDDQRALARFAGISLPDDLPVIVAGARIQNALADSLGIDAPSPTTDTQDDLLDILRRDDDAALPAFLDYREAGAWIEFYRLRRRQEALEALQLVAGDVVTIPEDEGDLLYEVSSIGDDGRVHFRGGMGRGAWPDRLMVVCRRTDRSKEAREARGVASPQAAARAKTDSWSLAKQAELSEFEVNRSVSRDDVDILRATIEGARDEKPIQRLVERRPQLLTALLGGSTRFCVPRVKLGTSYVTDFLISDVDSRGIRWLLVELETPRSSVTLQTTNELDRPARKGVSQVKEWREWLATHLHDARRFRKDNGLGLPDIRSESDGLVLVGRRHLLLDNSSEVRHRLREESRIDVRTYDWWLEQLESTLSYGGLPATSPYVVRRPDDDDDG